ncbi:UxaA family hydrolase [Oceanirhabdus seepicola]|nr:UxaA family hydrolase [Oceanirhabdus seepicola]
MTFNGYVRKDGSVGIRNNILIIAVDECMDGVARKISEEVESSIVVTNHYTCMLGGNEETLSNMINAALNPNVAGALVLAMGCGSIDPKIISDKINESGKLARHLTCIKKKGTKRTIEEGKILLKEIEDFASTFEREAVDISKLIVGVKCGGSDTSSGLASNPSVGKAADLLVDRGATVVAGELMELVGCEEILCNRAVNKEVEEKMLRMISNEEKRWSVGSDTEVMSVGNSVGGLTTIEEKSIGALHKTGTREIQDVLEFNQQGHEKPEKPGMYLSDVTMLCGGSGMHFAAIGAQLILWTSGGAGFNNSIVPVIRVSGNVDLINDDIDIDATGIMKGTVSVDEIGEEILEKIVQVANGEKTNIEDLGYSYCTLYQKDIRLEQCLGLR